MSLYDLKLFTQQNPETDFDTLRPYLRYLVAKGTPGEAAALAEYEQLANSGAVNPRWNEGTGKQAWQLAHPGEAPTPAWLILQELTAEAEKPAVPPTATPPSQPPTVPTLLPGGPPDPVLPPETKDLFLPTPGQKPPTAPDIFAFFTKQIGLADSIAVLETVRDGLKRAHEIGQISDLEFGQLSLTYANRHDALSVSTEQPETPQDLVPKWKVGDRVNTPDGPATITAVSAGRGSRLTRYEVTLDKGGDATSEEGDLSPFTGGLTGGGRQPGPGDGSGPILGPRFVEDLLGNKTAFLQQRGLQSAYLTPEQRYEQSQFAPIANTYNIFSKFAALDPNYRGKLPTDFANYLATVQRGGGGAEAQKAINALFAADPAQRERAGNAFQTPTGQPVAAANQSGLAALIYAALRDSVGQPGAAWVASQVNEGGQAEQAWLNQQAQGGPLPFLDFLRQRYALQGVPPA